MEQAGETHNCYILLSNGCCFCFADMDFKTSVLLLVVFIAGIHLCSGSTDPQDASALRALMNQMENTPVNWTGDPCGTPWEGVTCRDSRVTVLKLSGMGLKGTLSEEIGLLTELQTLDVSYNRDLGGSLAPSIENLKQLTTLILAGCSFSGKIPSEIGSLPLLTFIALNSNNFSGSIPASLGRLPNLYWLDLADNQLSGSLPISTANAPGLDQLHHAKHFHFNNNKLSGSIPGELFRGDMSLIHLLLNDNLFTGTIPPTIGAMQSLKVLRLDNNLLTGAVPLDINNLTSLQELNLAKNDLAGRLPDLTRMNSLNFVDLSNNRFDPSEAPAWLSTMQSLTTVAIESGNLHGQVPEKMFNLPNLQAIKLKNNSFNGTLTLSNSISPQLQLVDFQNNAITALQLSASYDKTLILAGNPVCNTELSNTAYCAAAPSAAATPYSTNITQCGATTCSSNQSINPASCACAYPYEGEMIFRAPQFRDLANSTLFHMLEMSLWTQLELAPDAVSIDDVTFNSDGYLQMDLKLFPSGGGQFNGSEILRLGSELINQTYRPPTVFGPYYFVASPYRSPPASGSVSGVTPLLF